MGSYKISQKWSNGREVTYTNTNELINPNSQYYYSKAIGFKTGSTKAAGDCLVAAVSINGQSYLCVVMGSSVGVRFMDSLTVFNAIDKEIPLAPIKKADSHVPTPVAPGELGGIE